MNDNLIKEVELDIQEIFRKNEEIEFINSNKVISAFTALREKLFQEDVLDVSTDLDVLEAMMSQEGLLDDELGSMS